MTVLRLNINNCVVAGVLGFQKGPLEKGAVSQDRAGGTLLEFGKAVFCSKGSAMSSLALERGVCRALLKELKTASVLCMWRRRVPLSLV